MNGSHNKYYRYYVIFMAFIDTNVIFMALYDENSKAGKIIQYALENKIKLYSTDKIRKL